MWQTTQLWSRGSRREARSRLRQRSSVAVIDSGYHVARDRGQVFDGPAGSGARVIGTIHPSAVLRAPDETRDEAFAGLVADLCIVAGLLTPGQ